MGLQGERGPKVKSNEVRHTSKPLLLAYGVGIHAGRGLDKLVGDSVVITKL